MVIYKCVVCENEYSAEERAEKCEKMCDSIIRKRLKSVMKGKVISTKELKRRLGFE